MRLIRKCQSAGLDFDSLRSLLAITRCNVVHSPKSNNLVRGGQAVVHFSSNSGTVIFILLLHSPQQQTGGSYECLLRFLPIFLEILIGSCNLLATATDTTHRNHYLFHRFSLMYSFCSYKATRIFSIIYTERIKSNEYTKRMSVFEQLHSSPGHHALQVQNRSSCVTVLSAYSDVF